MLTFVYRLRDKKSNAGEQLYNGRAVKGIDKRAYVLRYVRSSFFYQFICKQ